MKNIILGQAYNYTFEQLSPFVISLQRSGYVGDIVLFTNRVAPECQQRLAQAGVQLREFRYRGHEVRNSAYVAWPYLRWMNALPLPFAVKRAVLRPIVNVPWVRMILYHDFLRENFDRYSNVFLTDVRDVIFQADPFVPGTRPGLRVFLEDESMRIGTSKANIHWITDLFGPAELARLGGLPISCSGTIIGDVESMLQYLRAFIDAAFTVRSTRLNGGDQGIHNYLVHGRFREVVQLLPNGASEVLTMGYVDSEKMPARDSEGRFLDRDGRIIPVLHQYDRHTALAADLIERFRERIPQD